MGYNRVNVGVAKRTKGFQPKRGVRNVEEFDITAETSLSVSQFENLFRQIQITTARNGKRKVQTVLSDRMRVLMVLHWLREKPKMRILAQKFNVAVGTVHADVEVCVLLVRTYQ